MPKSALPEGWVPGPDHKSWLMSLKMKLQILLAAGPRVPSGFFKWREMPILLFGKNGRGFTRYENSNGSQFGRSLWCLNSNENYYLSRIQPWCRWHFAIQWPLHIIFHVYWKEEYVNEYPNYNRNENIGRMFYIAVGCLRDADKVYFWPHLVIGGKWV